LGTLIPPSAKPQSNLFIVISEKINEQNQYLITKTNKINNEYFEIAAKYTYIRSYAGGGGIFIIKMTPKMIFLVIVSLQINVREYLSASEIIA
jgi:hypothetical protein